MKAEQQPGFFFFFDWLDDCADLEAETQIEFVRAIAHYAQTGEKPEKLSPVVSLLTRSVFREIDLQKRKREQIREMRRSFGRLGGRPRKQQDFEKPKGFEENHKVFEESNEKQKNLNQDQDLNQDQEFKKNLSLQRDEKKSQKVLTKFGQRIAMTEDEHSKLCVEFGAQAVAIELAIADDWLLAKGRTQKDYAAFMRNWLRRNAAQQRRGQRGAGRGHVDVSGDYYERSVAEMRAAGFDVIDCSPNAGEIPRENAAQN
jgi:hypothetical protein